MKSIFVFGSKSIGQLTKNFSKALDEYMKQGVRFLIGDCDGVEFNPNAEGAGHVRNNIGCWEVRFVTTEFLPGTYAYRREKDREMIVCCGEAICLWDHCSKGSGDNIRELADQENDVSGYYEWQLMTERYENDNEERGDSKNRDKEVSDTYYAVEGN